MSTLFESNDPVWVGLEGFIYLFFLTGAPLKSPAALLKTVHFFLEHDHLSSVLFCRSLLSQEYSATFIWNSVGLWPPLLGSWFEDEIRLIQN